LSAASRRRRINKKKRKKKRNGTSGLVSSDTGAFNIYG